MRGETAYLSPRNTEKLAGALHMSVDDLWSFTVASEESTVDAEEKQETRNHCSRCRGLDREGMEIAERIQKLPPRWRGKLEIRLQDIEYDLRVHRIRLADKSNP